MSSVAQLRADCGSLADRIGAEVKRVSDFEVTDEHVADAMERLSAHSGWDYLDAAYASAFALGGGLGHSAWPEFVQRVKDAAGNAEPKPARRRGRGK